MFTPFENYVGDDGRFSQTSVNVRAPSPFHDKLNAASQHAARLEQELAAARMEIADLKAKKTDEGEHTRKIEVAQRYARMLEDASLTVVGAEGRGILKEALEHYCRYLEG